MTDAKEALSKAIEAAGMRALVLADDLGAGFPVRAELGGELYGMSLKFTGGFLKYPPTYSDAVAAGLVSHDFGAGFYGRSCRIGAGLRHLSEKDGSSFFNGPALRLRKASYEGNQLELYLQPTSYLTVVGTNFGLSGYIYEGGAVGEPPLLHHNWARVTDWHKGLKASKLSDALSLHQVVHNGKDIFYVQRSSDVTINRGCYSSVAGVVEGLDMTIEAIRELKEELGAPDGEVRWLGLAVSFSHALPDLQGITRIDLNRNELAELFKEALDLGESSGVLYHLEIPKRDSKLRQVVKETLGHGHGGHWGPSGETGLLLALANLCGEEQLMKALADL